MITTLLGEAPAGLGHQYEPLGLLVETSPTSGQFRAVPWVLARCEIYTGANDRLPTAQVNISLARNAALPPPDPSENDPRQTDWQIDAGGEFVNAETFLGDGRRVRIQTMRQNAADDWVLFDGFIDRIQKSWSGSPANRGLTLNATSSIIAADREANQFFVGQWRRTRSAQLAVYQSGSESARNKCVRVTSVPCIFNPAGRANCSVTSLGFSSGSNPFDAFIFEDESPAAAQPAIKWNVARILGHILWASLQPGVFRPANPSDLPTPYDFDNYSSASHPEQLSWTSMQLAHLPWPPIWEPAGGEPLVEAGPNLYPLIEPYLDRTDEGSFDDPQERALLRTPSDLSIQGLSTLEAFAHVCHEAGLLFHVEHATGISGRVFTYLRFSVRGDRCGFTEGGTDEAVVIPNSSSGSVTQRLTSSETCSARAVYLYLTSDRFDGDNPPAGDAEQRAAVTFARDSAMEGALTIDDASRRSAVLRIGSQTLYEISCTLRPGWRPDTAFWDINGADNNAVQSVMNAIGGDTWRRRYSRAATEQSFRANGRYWVLNEDGFFNKDQYKRQFGPWNTDAIWEPFKWRTEGQIFELQRRGDDGWSARRRQFMNLTTYFAGRLAEPLVEISFNGTAGPWYDARQVHADVTIDDVRCGLWINNPDLDEITNPSPDATISTWNYVHAYLTHKLRVRVTALVAGDDALVAWSSAGTQFDGRPWIEILCDPDKFERILRFRPGTTQAAASNAIIGGPNSDLYVGENRDRQEDALRDVKRAADACSAPRVVGSTTIPWLWRDGRGPVDGYRVGDEVLGMQTGTSVTHWPFIGTRNPQFSAPRIVGIRYRYSEGEHSTTLDLEDRSWTGDGVVPADPNRQSLIERSQDAYARVFAARQAAAEGALR